MKLITLRYESKHRPQLQRLWRVAKAIVAGCERRWAYGPPETHEITVRATLRKQDGMILLHIRPQLALAANYWMLLAMQSEWSDWREHNCMQLVLRRCAILFPDYGPNGGFVLRNTAPVSADGQVREASPCRNVKVV